MNGRSFNKAEALKTEILNRICVLDISFKLYSPVNFAVLWVKNTYFFNLNSTINFSNLILFSK